VLTIKESCNSIELELKAFFFHFQGIREGAKIVTNFDVGEYTMELPLLSRVTQEDLIMALASGGCSPV
jgi:hypothetical protein